MVFPINTPNKASFILLLNIDAKATVNYDSIVRSCTPTNIINPIILVTFSFFNLRSIFLSIHIIPIS